MTLQGKVNDWVEAERARIITLSSAAVTGHGPTLFGVAALNRPHIKGMRRLEIVWRDGKEMIKAQIARFGVFLHPRAEGGRFILDMDWARRIIDNWKSNVYEQAVFFDPAHNPNDGSLGELYHLEAVAGDGVDAYFEPTPDGLEAIKSKKFNYASMEFHPDYGGSSEVQISAGEDLEEVNLIQLALAAVGDELQEETDMADQENQVPADSGTPAPAPIVPQTPPADGAAALALAERESALAEGEARLVKLQEKADATITQLEEERIALAERSRLAHVDAFMVKLGLPDDKGMCLDKGFMDAVETALKCRDFEGGAIKLSEGSEVDVPKMKAYLFEAVTAIAEQAPRVVPTAGGIRPSEKRPASDSTIALAQQRQEAFDNVAMAKKADRIAMTEEVKAEIWAEVDKLYPNPEGV